MDRWTFHARTVIGAGSILVAMLMGGILGYIDDSASIELALQMGVLVGVAMALLVFAGLFGVDGVEEDPSD
jgi:predicted transporter